MHEIQTGSLQQESCAFLKCTSNMDYISFLVHEIFGLYEEYEFAEQ